MDIHYSPGVSPLDFDDSAKLGLVAAHVLAEHHLAGSVQLVIVDDDYMASLNKAYRGKTSTTDVLSFSFNDAEGESIPFEIADGLEKSGGEIYISLRQADLQAEELGISVLEEMARLLTHGLLHLAGYEHDSERELLHMERETDRLLLSAGLLPVSL